MEAAVAAETPVSQETSTSTLNLVRNLTSDTKRLFKQEMELAKAELSEKFSLLARNSIAIAVGGFIAYAGIIVFLTGLGWLVGWALRNAGVDPMLAGFMGLGVVGLLVAAIGGLFVFKGMKTFSKNTLAPQRTIHSLQRLKGTEEPANGSGKTAPKRPSKEIEAQVAETENRMSATLDTLGERLSPHHINEQVKHRIRRNPYQSGLLAMAAGLVGGLFLMRGRRSAN